MNFNNKRFHPCKNIKKRPINPKNAIDFTQKCSKSIDIKSNACYTEYSFDQLGRSKAAPK